MKLSTLIKTNNEKLNNADVLGVTCNSKDVGERYIFVCINGTNVDGHKFAADALEKGAVAVVCERDLGLENQILVEDTHKAYFDISANWFDNPAKRLKLIGVTGTNGKTSVTYMLKKILEKAGHRVGLIGTIQNIIIDKVLPSKNTTPDAYEMNSLLSLMEKAGCEYVGAAASVSRRGAIPDSIRYPRLCNAAPVVSIISVATFLSIKNST